MALEKEHFLTDREREVFQLLIQNNSTREIADTLFICESTVRTHISHVIKKLDVKSRPQAILELIKWGELKILKCQSISLLQLYHNNLL